MPKKQKVPVSVKHTLTEQAVKGKIKQPDLAKLTAHFFEHAGGERAVAKMLYEEFASSPAGGVVRMRILDMIMRATRFANEKNAPVDDLGMLTDQDLENELQDLIEVVSEGEGEGNGEGLDTHDRGPSREEEAGQREVAPASADPPGGAFRYHAPAPAPGDARGEAPPGPGAS